MPWGSPSVLIHIQRALWMCPASIRMVRRGEPGTAAVQSSSGSRSMRKIVVRLFVDQAFKMLVPSAEVSDAAAPSGSFLPLPDNLRLGRDCNRGRRIRRERALERLALTLAPLPAASCDRT